MTNDSDTEDDALDLEVGQKLFEMLMDAAETIGARIVSSACISFLSLIVSRSADAAVREGAIEAIGKDIRNGFEIYDQVHREGLN